MKKTYLFLFLVKTTFLFGQHWKITELAPLPEAVSNNAVCEGYINERPYVYSFGGIDSSKSHSGIHQRSYRYDIEDNTWEALPDLPDTLGKIASSANRVGDLIYVIGGYHVFEDGFEVSSNKVHRFDLKTNTFISDGAPIPIPIDDQVQVVKDSLIYVISGWSNSINVRDVQVYNTVTDTWSSASRIRAQEVPVFGGAGTIVGDTIYFIGGAGNTNFSPIRKFRKGAISSTDPLDITWSSVSTSFRPYRPAATVARGKAYFIGGSDNTYNFDGLAYNNGQGVEPNNLSLGYLPAEGIVTAEEMNMLPMDLRGIGNVSDTVKYLAGGIMANQQVSNKLWKLELVDKVTSVQSESRSVSYIVYPNPNSGTLNVKYPDDISCTELTLNILDYMGKTRYSGLGCFNLIDLSGFVSGNYILQIYSNDDKPYTFKFVLN